MRINNQPLRLTDLALLRLVVLINGRFPPTPDSLSHIKPNGLVKEFIPSKIFNELFCLKAIFWHICKTEGFDEIYKKPQHLLPVILYSLMNQYETLMKDVIISDPIVNLLTRVAPICNMDEVVLKVKNIIEVSKSIPMYLIIENVCDYTILNNLMILFAYNDQLSLVKHCVRKGANDFTTSKKLACLMRNSHVTLYLENVEPLHVFTNIHRNEVYYNNYHRNMNDSAMSDGDDNEL